MRLAGYEQRKPNQLSGGQQQRVALARAIVNEPRVLLLDEPLGALDLKLREQMQVELNTIQSEVGITFIYVTHDQEEALTMSDRIAVFNDGGIEQVGPPTEIYERPQNAFVAGFVGVSNLLDVTGQFTVRPEKIFIVENGQVPSGLEEEDQQGTSPTRAWQLGTCAISKQGGNFKSSVRTGRQPQPRSRSSAAGKSKSDGERIRPSP